MDFANYREDIYSASLFYYPLINKKLPVTNFTVVMADKVDGDVLRHAAAKTIQRFPYLSLELKKDEKDMHLVYNPRPLTVLHTDKQITLCAEETNYHVQAVTYTENEIHVHALHGLVDGRGAMPFRATLLYYYCKEKYDENLEPPEIVRLVDTPIDEEEFAEPFLLYKQKNSSLKNISPSQTQSEQKTDTPNTKPDLYSILDDNKFATTDLHNNVLKVDESKFIQFCKSIGGTPNSVTSVLIAKAIDKYKTAKNKTIGVQFLCDLRKTLGVEKTHLSSVVAPLLYYTDEIKNMTLPEQCAEFRKQIKEKSTPETLAETAIKPMLMLFDTFKSFNTFSEKHALAKNIAPSGIGISYSGKSAWGSIEKYIEAIYVSSGDGSTGPDILVEINAVAGYFFFNFMQHITDNKYFNSFCDELKSCDMEFEIIRQEKANIADVGL